MGVLCVFPTPGSAGEALSRQVSTSMGDALITLNPDLARAAKELVTGG